MALILFTILLPSSDTFAPIKLTKDAYMRLTISLIKNDTSLPYISLSMPMSKLTVTKSRHLCPITSRDLCALNKHIDSNKMLRIVRVT